MERILVVLPNWFGETLFATPLLRALRRGAPGAFIATLGWPQCREVLLHNPDVDERLELDERGAHRGMGGKRRLVEALRARHADTAFLLRKSLTRSLMLALAGIPARVGFDSVKSGWLLTRRAAAPSPPTHKAETYFALLRAVGIEAPLEPYTYTVSEGERRRARELLPREGDGNQPLVILHPGPTGRTNSGPPPGSPR